MGRKLADAGGMEGNSKGAGVIQLNLFTEKHCSHCGQPMAPNPKNPHLANGFYDQDTAELVHWHCKAEHYYKKNLAGMQGLFSEMPVML